jgi:hypothetical protein
MFLSEQSTLGSIWMEYLVGAEDKQFLAGTSLMQGYGFPTTVLTPAVAISPREWHHLAFVKDANNVRWFIDGVLVASAPSSGAISNAGSGSSVAAVGSVRRDEGFTNPSFVGFIDTLRISNSARYSANFTAPTGDLGTDANTVVLLNFNEARASTTVADLSGNGENGTLTPWFSGATLPQLCPSPYVFDQPIPARVCQAATASMRVSAIGNGPFTYQWRKDTNAIDTHANASAATATLTLTNVGPADIASYDCIVTNACGSATSNPAAVTICLSDYNCDDSVDFFDYLDFVDAFATAAASADFNRDGVVDFYDYLDFVDAFSTGC